MAVFAACALICALVFWSTKQAWALAFYRVIPSIVLIYYVPTLASSLGIIPARSPVYDWMRDYLLPFSLFVLMVTSNLPAILKVGRKAILMMLCGTAGIVVGGPVAYLIFKSWLPPDAWKGLAALSGSWIGGGGNFAAIKESVGASDALVGPIIIVDTAVGYTWTGVLLFMANHQRLFNRWSRASSSTFDELNRRLGDYQEVTSKPMGVADATLTIALGSVGAVFCWSASGYIHQSSYAFLTTHFPKLADVFSPFTWMVILITSLGILLSFSPLRRIEGRGGTTLGYTALYIFLASLGAKADLHGLIAAPILLLVGAVWILIHVLFLIAGARLLRAPLFLLAVGSQANIGGVATAPIVAAAYYKALAPLGLLMGVFGYLIGNYAGLLCAFLLGLVA